MDVCLDVEMVCVRPTPIMSVGVYLGVEIEFSAGLLPAKPGN